MSEVSKMSQRMMFGITPSAISSQESQDGASPSGTLDGRKIDRSGQGRVRVSRFRAQESGKALPTNDISGPLFNNLSPSASLQQSLENRLRAKMDGSGCPLFAYDLESLGYACGAADLPAASVGAPHIRQRLCWVADARHHGEHRRQHYEDPQKGGPRRFRRKGIGPSPQAHGRKGKGGEDWQETGQAWGDAARDDERRPRQPDARDGRQGEAGGSGAGRGMGDANGERPQGRRLQLGEGEDEFAAWSSVAFIPCADGKARPAEPGIFPLADGVPGRVGRLRAYGNAIVPQVAAAFIQAHMGDMEETEDYHYKTVGDSRTRGEKDEEQKAQEE